MREVDVDFLADHPGLLPRVARWVHREWLKQWGLSRRQAIDELRTRLSRDALPLALLARLGGVPVGIASLIELEHPLTKQPLSCLAGLYVLPRWRRVGVGTLLCRRATLEATRLGRPAIGLFTQQGQAFYERLGWLKVMDVVPPRSGEQSAVTFMEQACGTGRGEPAG